MDRRLFIGDVHGCRRELEELIEQFSPGVSDGIYSVGDLIHKGPDSLGVLEIVEKLQIQAVLGNHERHFLRVVKKASCRLSISEQAFIAQFRGELTRWANEIGNWPLFRDLGDILVVHAGLQPGVEDPAEMSAKVLTTIRTWREGSTDLDNEDDLPWYEQVHLPQTVVFGHWAIRGRVDLPGFKGLDTGCLYGGELTGWCPEEDCFYVVQSRERYVDFCLNRDE